MNKYFYSDGQQSFGPFGLDELHAMNVVAPSTKVWCQGMVDWADASTVEELGDWFAATPPPITPTLVPPIVAQQISLPNRPYSWLVPSIISTVCCCVPFGIVGIVYAAKVETRYNQGDYQGAQAAANSAKTWFWWSVGVAGFVFLCSILLAVVGVVTRF